MDVCHVLTKGSGVYSCLTLESDRLSEDEGATELEAEEEGGTHTAVKDRDTSYYTGTIRASKLHYILGCHYWAERPMEKVSTCL